MVVMQDERARERAREEPIPVKTAVDTAVHRGHSGWLSMASWLMRIHSC